MSKVINGIISITIILFIIFGFGKNEKQTEFSSNNNCTQINDNSEQTKNSDQTTKKNENNSEFPSSNDCVQIDKNSKQRSNSNGVKSNQPKQPAKKSTKNSTLSYRIVYITKTGEKYHYKICGRGSYFAVSLEDAVNMGYELCRKCAKH